MIRSKNIKVTIAIVTYNSMPYVKTAINSVLASTYQNLEIIISDDCSNDGTWETIQTYPDNRIIKKRNEINLGEYANRNQCIDLATGEYFIFIDGDDYIYPHGIETMLKLIGENTNFGFAVMRPYHKKIIYPAYLSPRAIYISEFFGEGLINHAFTNTLFDTAVLKKERLQDSFISGDTYIRLKIAQTHQCLLLNDNLTWWRNRQGQASEKLKFKYYSDFKKISKVLFVSDECPLNIEEQEDAIKIIDSKIFLALVASLKRLNFKEAYSIFRNNPIRLFSLFHRIELKDPLINYSPEKPLTINDYA